MKTINSEVLRALPREVRDLVRNGTYSLYTLKSTGAAAYLLIASGGEQYFLGLDGSLMPGAHVANIRDAIDQAVSFSDAMTSGVMINCA